MSRRRAKKRNHEPETAATSRKNGPAELRPSRPARDLLDRAPVRLCADGDLLVGHGFGGQRVAIPRSSVKALGTYLVPRPRNGPRQGLVVLDGENRTLLRAPGAWSDVSIFSRNAGLPAPRHRYDRRLWRRAPGYRRLRTRPRGAGLADTVVLVVVLAASVYGGAAGLFLARMLPGSLGAVRLLGDAVAVVAGVIAGLGVGLTGVGWATAALKRIARLLVRFLGCPVPETPPARPASAARSGHD